MYVLNDNARSLNVGEFNTSVYQSKIFGVCVEFTFTCGGWEISSLTGTASVKDYWDYNYIHTSKICGG